MHYKLHVTKLANSLFTCLCRRIIVERSVYGSFGLILHSMSMPPS